MKNMNGMKALIAGFLINMTFGVLLRLEYLRL